MQMKFFGYIYMNHPVCLSVRQLQYTTLESA